MFNWILFQWIIPLAPVLLLAFILRGKACSECGGVGRVPTSGEDFDLTQPDGPRGSLCTACQSTGRVPFWRKRNE